MEPVQKRNLKPYAKPTIEEMPLHIDEAVLGTVSDSVSFPDLDGLLFSPEG
jgi:hypothetical protein